MTSADHEQPFVTCRVLMRVRVKICGITNYEDAAMALELGADALGFNFYPPSPRYVECAVARDIIRRLPPFAATVGVFVNVAHPAEVDRSARAAGVQVLQLHGDEPADYCRGLAAWPLIKAVRVHEAWVPESLLGFPAQAFLLDSRDERIFGGTGMTFDWTLARRAPTGLKIVLAGGLNPANVAQAIRSVRPYGVDACSGVEVSPGRKDPAKLAAFMKEVFDATAQLSS
jgi:phosphoribosylanthranilate isomerase